MGVKHLTELVGADDPAYDINPTEWNQDHIMDNDVPPTPASGKLAMFVKSLANVLFPSYITPSAEQVRLQPHAVDKVYSYQLPIGPIEGNITILGAFDYARQGSNDIAFLSNANLYRSLRRSDYAVTSAGSSNVASFYEQGDDSFAINCPSGYTVSITWGQGKGASNTSKRAFAGLGGGGDATDVNPSTLTNIIGMGWDSGDTNCQVFHNDASGTATKINLGALFPVPTSDLVDFYQITISSPPNTSEVSYTIKNMNSGAVAEGTITTNIPTERRRKRMYASVGGVSAQIGISFFGSFHTFS